VPPLICFGGGAFNPFSRAAAFVEWCLQSGSFPEGVCPRGTGVSHEKEKLEFGYQPA
jgi:hypothetical protein